MSVALARQALLDRVTREYVELYRRASTVIERPNVAKRAFDRGWLRLREARTWEDAPVGAEVHSAVGDLLDRVQYVEDSEGLLTWLEALPQAALAYLEPAAIEFRVTSRAFAMQTSFAALGTWSFIVPSADAPRFRLRFWPAHVNRDHLALPEPLAA